MGVYTFLKGIRPKVNVKAQLEFELVYSDVPVQHVSPHTTGDCPKISNFKSITKIYCFTN